MRATSTVVDIEGVLVNHTELTVLRHRHTVIKHVRILG